MGRVAQSVQRLATGWTVRGSNSGGGEVFRTCPDRPWGPPSPLYNGYRVFPGGKVGPGRAADPSSLLVPWSRKSRAIPLLPSGPHRACNGITLLLPYGSNVGRDSSVGVSSRYGLDGVGSNPGWDEIFRPSRPALGPTQPPVQWVPGLSCG